MGQHLGRLRQRHVPLQVRKTPITLFSTLRASASLATMLAEVCQALNRLDVDVEIERRKQALRENWGERSDATRESSEARLRDLRHLLSL